MNSALAAKGFPLPVRFDHYCIFHGSWWTALTHVRRTSQSRRKMYSSFKLLLHKLTLNPQHERQVKTLKIISLTIIKRVSPSDLFQRRSFAASGCTSSNKADNNKQSSRYIVIKRTQCEMEFGKGTLKYQFQFHIISLWINVQPNQEDN